MRHVLKLGDNEIEITTEGCDPGSAMITVSDWSVEPEDAPRSVLFELDTFLKFLRDEVLGGQVRAMGDAWAGEELSDRLTTSDTQWKIIPRWHEAWRGGYVLQVHLPVDGCWTWVIGKPRGGSGGEAGQYSTANGKCFDPAAIGTAPGETTAVLCAEEAVKALQRLEESLRERGGALK